VRPGSLSLRLALWVGLLGLLQACGVLLFSYSTLAGELDAQRRVVLRDKADQVRYLLADMKDASAVRDNAFRLVELVTGHAELHLAVAAPDSREPYAAFSQEAMESAKRLRGDTWGTDAFLDWQSQGDGRRMLSFAAAGETKDGQLVEIVVSVDRTDDQQLLRELLLTSAVAAPFGLAVVFVCAALITAFGLRPLQRFQETAAAISTTSVATRLTLSGQPTELQALGAAFNSMLDRLDDGISRLSEFSSDLAHEMRTPLATLLGRTQVALSQPRTTDQLVDVLEGNVEELQQLSRLISDMLFLAQSEHAKAALHLTRFDLRAEAVKVADYLELLAQERDVGVVVEGAGTVVADQGLVQRAITNLVSNAVRHCSSGTQVRILVGADADRMCLAVVNLGEPIAPEHLGRLFDRFYRVDSSRNRDAGGTGLGLAIVKAIMKLHGGKAEASSTPAGETRFTLTFPELPAPRAATISDGPAG
jgi:two-component system, OmpR family, heavy metal sensor histidine kinase CusS